MTNGQFYYAFELEESTLPYVAERVGSDKLLYSSDYPHWDFDLPSTISDLPFLSEKAKHNILGGTAARLFKLEPGCVLTITPSPGRPGAPG